MVVGDLGGRDSIIIPPSPHLERHVHVRRLVDIHVAHAVRMAQYWDAGVVLDEADQRIAAPASQGGG